MHENYPTAPSVVAPTRRRWPLVLGAILFLSCCGGLCGLGGLSLHPGWRLARGKWVLGPQNEHIVDRALREALNPVMLGEQEITFHPLGKLTHFDRPIGRERHGNWNTTASQGNSLTLHVAWDDGRSAVWKVASIDSTTIQITDSAAQYSGWYRWSRSE